MNKHRAILTSKRRLVIRAILWLLAGVVLFLTLIQSLTVTAAWWRKELPVLGVINWFWILLLPILIGLYLRFFSVFRTDCRACLPPPRRTPQGPRGP